MILIVFNSLWLATGHRVKNLYATLVYYFHFLGFKVTQGIFMILKYEAQRCTLFFSFLKRIALNYNNNHHLIAIEILKSL